MAVRRGRRREGEEQGRVEGEGQGRVEGEEKLGRSKREEKLRRRKGEGKEGQTHGGGTEGEGGNNIQLDGNRNRLKVRRRGGGAAEDLV